MDAPDHADGTDETDRSGGETSRRRVLLGTGAALSTLLAGCSIPGGGGEDGEGGGGGEGGENGGGESGEGGENGGEEGGGGGENDD